MIRLLWGLSVLSAAAIIGAAIAADLLVHAPSSLILRAVRRWREDRYNTYWLGDYNETTADEDAVSAALAAVGEEARAGCTCEGCDRIRAAAAEALFRVTDEDIAELARHGIAWGSQ